MFQNAEFNSLFQNADHVDVKTVEGSVTLRQFLANFLDYQPTWLTALYRVRGLFVRLLGMHQNSVPQPPRLTPETVPMQPGKPLSFFKTRFAKEDAYWFGEADDSHLSGVLGVVVEPITETTCRFRVITIVHYHNWAGPVYFNVIRPFHHLVLSSMAKAAVHDHQPAK
jgi:hypothetical protein